MAFSEDLKLQVKKMAMFQCCRCHETGVEIHHLIPQYKNGPDTIENAAPLCPNCHSWFGNNPDKAKEIREMRDNWYEVINRMYPSGPSINELEKINSKLEEIYRNQQPQDLNELKKLLVEITTDTVNKMTLGTASLVATNLVNASGASGASLPAQFSGGRGGNILIFGSRVRGNGAILVDGGDGFMGGDAGRVEIHSSDNQFKGTISAKGGKGKK